MIDTRLPDLAIRIEIPANFNGLREVNREAFGREAEADLVDTLRQNGKFVLSLVALLDDRVVGHIVFTDLLGSTRRIAGLGPMAVRPAYQRRGIGGALVRSGLEYLREQSYAAVVVLGHKDYYPKFGFLPAANFGIRTQFEASPGYLLVAPLSGSPIAPGTVRYQPEFETLAP